MLIITLCGVLYAMRVLLKGIVCVLVTFTSRTLYMCDRVRVRTPPLCRFLTGRLRAGRPFIAVLRLHAACQIVSGIDRSGRQDVLSVASGVASVNRKGKHRISFLSVYRSSRN